MNDLLKWIRRTLPIREDVESVLKIGDKVILLQKDRPDSNVYTFRGYAPCKWIRTHYQQNSCAGCRGKLTIENDETKKVTIFCGTFAVRDVNYTKVKILDIVLPDDLFDI